MVSYRRGSAPAENMAVCIADSGLAASALRGLVQAEQSRNPPEKNRWVEVFPMRLQLAATWPQ